MLGAISTPFFTKRASPALEPQQAAQAALPVSPLLQMAEPAATKPVEGPARFGSLLDLADALGSDEMTTDEGSVRAAYDEAASA